jgi:hypothetical protein
VYQTLCDVFLRKNVRKALECMLSESALKIITICTVLFDRPYKKSMLDFSQHSLMFSLLLHRTSIWIDFSALSMQLKMAKFQLKLGKQTLKKNSEGLSVTSLKPALVH